MWKTPTKRSAGTTKSDRVASLSVIGLDGVNWKVLEHAVEKGLMPNLESVLDDCYGAELETTYPSVTGPAWTSIMTGDNPGSHGVFDFVNHVEGGRPYSSSDVKTEAIHEAVSRRGDVAVVNLPLSYPPRFDGEFVGSFLAPEDDYVRPATLEEEFDFSGYRKSLTASEKAFSVVKSGIEAAEDKEELLETLLDDQDLFFLLFSAPDWIMHDHYHEMEEGGKSDAYQVFATIDSAISTAVERSDNVVLLSDHGFQSFTRVFHVNQWLKNQGYLETAGSMSDPWNDNPVVNAALKAASSTSFSRRAAVKLFNATRDYLPIPENHQVRVLVELSEGIDMERSQAFCPSSGIRGIYINDDRFHGLVDDPESLKQELLDAIPGEVEARDGEEVFEGSRAEEAPDIVFEEKQHRVLRTIYGEEFSSRRVNHHGRKGFLVAAGEDFESREERGDRRLYDVAPTVAELFGLEFEADGDPIGIVTGEAGAEISGDPEELEGIDT